MIKKEYSEIEKV